ncbi:MAG: hypothetical protein KGJ13_13305, partial [Patescibacteria group bacterium]|nr:hypothetical protein [Patescibacteria group bacterium]
AITVADTSIQLEQGIYDITADNNCFIELNQNASLTGSYPLRGGLVYGGLRIVANDKLHLIAAAAGGNLYISPVS